jgi:hypothetical protein
VKLIEEKILRLNNVAQRHLIFNSKENNKVFRFPVSQGGEVLGNATSFRSVGIFLLLPHV